MRQIGTLAKTMDPRIFGDYLLSLGVTSRAIESADGWAIWVHDEDRVPKARTELEEYTKNPDDPRYQGAATTAEAVRRESERLDRLYHKNVRRMSGRWDRLNARRRPLTVALIAICIGLFFLGGFSPGAGGVLKNRLWFYSVATMARPGGGPSHGLEDILRGEVWRLVTPIFLHVNLLHLAFNMWVMAVEGSIIEYRRGTPTLAALVFLSAIVSNIGQYLFILEFSTHLAPWEGISGVGYALFGYLWMKGRNEPEQGMILHPNTVRIMLLWLFLGFTGIMPMANGAHLAGLIVGMLFGLARF